MKTGTVVGSVLGAALLGWIFWPKETKVMSCPGTLKKPSMGPDGSMTCPPPEQAMTCPGTLKKTILLPNGQIACPPGTSPISPIANLNVDACACGPVSAAASNGTNHPNVTKGQSASNASMFNPNVTKGTSVTSPSVLHLTPVIIVPGKGNTAFVTIDARPDIEAIAEAGRDRGFDVTIQSFVPSASVSEDTIVIDEHDWAPNGFHGKHVQVEDDTGVFNGVKLSHLGPSGSTQMWKLTFDENLSATEVVNRLWDQIAQVATLTPIELP